MRPRLVAAAIAIGSIGAIAVGLLTAGDSARRPEGAAERYLQALSNDHDRDQWGDAGLARALVDFESDNDTLFATIEVGRANVDRDTATVPARIVRNDSAATEIHLALTARRASGREPRGWSVVALEQVPSAALPSNGGARPSRAAATLWPAAVVTALAFAAAADLTVTRLRRRRGLPQPARAVAEIVYDELTAKLDAGTIVLVDAQAPGRHEQEHLPGAQPIDWHAIAASATRLIPAPDSEVVVYCWNAACTGSEVIAEELVKLGYRRVRRYVGGKQDWVDHGGPLDGAPTPSSA